MNFAGASLRSQTAMKSHRRREITEANFAALSKTERLSVSLIRAGLMRGNHWTALSSMRCYNPYFKRRPTLIRP